MADNIEGYILLSDELYNIYKDDIRLNPIEANDGNYYVDDNCVNTCPDIFTSDVPIVWLSREDFPKIKIENI